MMGIRPNDESLEEERFRNANLAKPLVVYLAGGIANLNDDQVHGWRERIKSMSYGSSNIVFLDPTRRDYRGYPIGMEQAQRIVKWDKKDIQDSDVVLAYCPMPSWGTAMEILYAHEMDKWLIVVSSGVNVSPWLIYHTDSIVYNLDMAAEQLKELAKNM